MITPTENNERTIINRAVDKVVKEGLDLKIAVEDAIDDVLPEAMVERDDGFYNLEIPGTILYRLQKKTEQGVKIRKMKDKPKLCECGCGVIVNKGRRFRQGHDARTHKKPVPTT